MSAREVLAAALLRYRSESASWLIMQRMKFLENMGARSAGVATRSSDLRKKRKPQNLRSSLDEAEKRLSRGAAG
jgi:hypothetical protein